MHSAFPEELPCQMRLKVYVVQGWGTCGQNQWLAEPDNSSFVLIFLSAEFYKGRTENEEGNCQGKKNECGHVLVKSRLRLLGQCTFHFNGQTTAVYQGDILP